MFSQELIERASRIRLVVFDVDGVLTDGKLYYSADGQETKAFHVQDGAALKMLQQVGLHVGIITGRDSTMVSRRASELGITLLHQNAGNKLDALKQMLAQSRELVDIDLSQCACIGDDLADIVLFEAVGLGIGVPNGHPASHPYCHWVTTVAGGQGVAREVAELLLRSQGQWPYR